jgi:DNA polymerase-3 subunit delta'
MAWNKLLGLYKEKYLIQTAILNNKIASAYCFVGMEGIGKDAFAIEFAKAVNCYSPIITSETDMTGTEYQTYTA